MPCEIKLLIFILFLFTKISSNSTADHSNSANKSKQNDKANENSNISCPAFKSEFLDSVTNLTFSVPTDSNIARLRHVNGIKPIHYNITMNFLDVGDTNFTSKIRIKVAVEEATQRLIIDFNPNSLTFEDTSKIYIESGSTTDKVVCITSVIYVKKEGKMIAELNKKLDRGQYIIHMGTVKGSPRSDLNPDLGSVGLSRGAGRDSWALNTIFQMRYARTVFPCFDHPSLKATFQICIEHSKETTAASNSQVEKTQLLKNNRILECFNDTLKIPTYLVTFALMLNFSITTDKSNSPQLDVYYPTSVGAGKYQWEPREARQVIEYLQNVTNFTFALPKLAFMNVYNAPFWGVENFGLITLENGFTSEPDYERGHTNLVHEIVHQWLGDVATISDWSEICLQEGLTAFYEWTISYFLKIAKTPVSAVVAGLRSEAFYKSYGNPIIRQYNLTQQIADYCFGMPPVVLNMISQRYDNIWNKFLKKYINKYHFSNANLTDWVNTLNDAAGDKDAGAILESWFTIAGYPVFYSYINENNSITVQQYIHTNEYKGDSAPKPQVPNKPKITPLNLMSKSSPSANQNLFVVKSVNKTYPLKNVKTDDWFVVDPSMITLSRNVYPVKNYFSLIQCFTTSQNECSLQLLNIVFQDFCYALVNDWFPWESHSDNFDADSWITLFEKLLSITAVDQPNIHQVHGIGKVRIDNTCHTCMSSKEQIENSKAGFFFDNPPFIWNHRCRNLNLINLINRNYTVNEKKGHV